MRVLACHADLDGCGFYRMICPSTVLKAHGMDVILDYKGISTRGYVKDNRVIKMEPIGADVMVIQRPMTLEAMTAIPLIKEQGVAVVVELDDDFWSLTPQHEAYKRLHPNNNKEVNTQFLWECLKLADLVTVSTPALAKIIPNENVVVIRNCVPAYYMELERPPYESDKLLVGWTGSPSNHPGDLEVMGAALRAAVHKNKAQFITIGDEETISILGFNEGEALYSPWVELKNYAGAVKVFDVGVVPLRRSRFNDCKSYLKGLEYSAVGVPFVASPVEEYRYLNEQGIGLLAPQKHDWQKQLGRLISSKTLREEQIGRGSEFARENTYERNAWRWYEAWEQATKVRK